MQTIKIGKTGWVIKDQIRSCSAIHADEMLIMINPKTGKNTEIAILNPTDIKIIYKDEHIVHISWDDYTILFRARDEFADFRFEFENAAGPIKPIETYQ